MRRAAAFLLAVAIFGGAILFVQINAGAASPERSGFAQPRRYSIRWLQDPAIANKIDVEVAGLRSSTLRVLEQSNWKLAQWHRLLSLYVEPEKRPVAGKLLPMLGAYRVHPGTLRFEPQFPLEPGLRYRAVLNPRFLPGNEGLGADLVTADYGIPAQRPDPTTVVSHVYPSARILPENLLKFYVHFSAPMSRGRIYDHIQLRDDSGKEIKLPFLEIDEELWDPTMSRLTLFIDPGRIKQGVLPLEEIGPALEAGKRYTLGIDREWMDGAGNSLKQSFQKSFDVGPPDRDPPDPARWKIQAPRADLREPLVVVFPEPMDHALAQRVIRVTNAAGEAIEGKVFLEDEERRWTFNPALAWKRGLYKIVTPTTIEDLAGNNIGKPFEVDLFEGVQRRMTTNVVSLSFEVF